MPSPFPGMNPYFEQTDHWLDFHTELLSAFRRLLAPQVGPKYIVQLEEHIYIHDLPPEPRQRLGTADLSLVQPGGGELLRAALGLLEAPSEVWLPEQDVEEVPYPGGPGPPGPRAGDRHRAVEPVEQAGRRRPRAVSRQASRAASDPGPPGRNRPAARMDADAAGRPARVRLFGHGQSGREATGRGFLAHQAEGPAAGHPHAAAAPGRRRPGWISRKRSTEPMTGPATSTSSTTASRNQPLSPNDAAWARQFAPASA